MYNKAIISCKPKHKLKLNLMNLFAKIKYLFIKINSNNKIKSIYIKKYSKILDYYLYLFYYMNFKKKSIKILKKKTPPLFNIKPFLGLTVTFKKKNTFWNLYDRNKNISFISIGSSRYKKKSWWNFNVKFKITKKLINKGLNHLALFFIKYKGFHEHWNFIYKAIFPKFKIYYITIKLLQPHNGCKGIHKRNRRETKKKQNSFFKHSKFWPKNT